MKCPHCQSSSKIVDTRKKKGKVIRRHQCNHCGRSFPTVEIHQEEYDKIRSVPQVERIRNLAEQIVAVADFIKEDNL